MGLPEIVLVTILNLLLVCLLSRSVAAGSVGFTSTSVKMESKRVAKDSGWSVSRVVAVLLGFYWELNGLAEKARFLAEVNERFRTTT